MAGVSPRLSHGDPLQLDPNWSCSVPLLAFEEAFKRGLPIDTLQARDNDLDEIRCC